MLVNPNCVVRLIYLYIRMRAKISSRREYDLCSEHGQMVSLYRTPKDANGLSVLKQRDIYYILTFAVDENGKINDIRPLLAEGNPLFKFLKDSSKKNAKGPRKRSTFGKSRRSLLDKQALLSVRPDIRDTPYPQELHTYIPDLKKILFKDDRSTSRSMSRWKRTGGSSWNSIEVAQSELNICYDEEMYKKNLLKTETVDFTDRIDVCVDVEYDEPIDHQGKLEIVENRVEIETVDRSSVASIVDEDNIIKSRPDYDEKKRSTSDGGSQYSFVPMPNDLTGGISKLPKDKHSGQDVIYGGGPPKNKWWYPTGEMVDLEKKKLLQGLSKQTVKCTTARRATQLLDRSTQTDDNLTGVEYLSDDNSGREQTYAQRVKNLYPASKDPNPCAKTIDQIKHLPKKKVVSSRVDINLFEDPL